MRAATTVRKGIDALPGPGTRRGNAASASRRAGPRDRARGYTGSQSRAALLRVRAPPRRNLACRFPSNEFQSADATSDARTTRSRCRRCLRARAAASLGSRTASVRTAATIVAAKWSSPSSSHSVARVALCFPGTGQPGRRHGGWADSTPDRGGDARRGDVNQASICDAALSGRRREPAPHRDRAARAAARGMRAASHAAWRPRRRRRRRPQRRRVRGGGRGGTHSLRPMRCESSSSGAARWHRCTTARWRRCSASTSICATAVCDDVQRESGDIVVVANHNAPGQLVISGTRAGVDAAGKLALERGARRVIPLNVSGAFHSPLMTAAAATFARHAGHRHHRRSGAPGRLQRRRPGGALRGRAARAAARAAHRAGAMDRVRANARRARRRDARRGRTGHRADRSGPAHRPRGADGVGEHRGRRRSTGRRRWSPDERGAAARGAAGAGDRRLEGHRQGHGDRARARRRGGGGRLLGASRAARDRSSHRCATEHGVDAVALGADLADAAAAGTLVDQTVQALGGIDIVVNNAGITRDNLALRLSDDDWDAVIAVDLTAAFHICRAALRPMLRQRFGRIVNVSSVSGVIGNPGQANYSAAKAGLIGLTKSLAREVGSRDITVNAVAPGFIETEMTTSLGDDGPCGRGRRNPARHASAPRRRSRRRSRSSSLARVRVHHRARPARRRRARGVTEPEKRNPSGAARSRSSTAPPGPFACRPPAADAIVSPAD